MASSNVMPVAFTKLVEQFEKLPGIGHKMAQKLAFHLLSLPPEKAHEFTDTINTACNTIKYCKCCRSLSDSDLCSVCADESRDHSIICVVEDTRYLIAIERTREFKGTYHVLHGLISPMDNIGPEQLAMKELVARVSEGNVKEVIVATNPTVEGDVTAMYISKLLKPLGVNVSRLAYGVPVGADIEYADEVTLGRALEGRSVM